MSYESLLSIYSDSAIEASESLNALSTECPNDGTLLVEGPEGVFTCPFDGYVLNGMVSMNYSGTSISSTPAGSYSGSSGRNGLSAYQIALANGFVGTEEEWLASLQGADGADGATGPAGAQGPAGPTDVVNDDITIKNSDGNWPAAVPMVIKQATDANNAGTNASYITTGASGRRMFFGDATSSAVLNLRYVSSIESHPAFLLTDGTTIGQSVNASHMFGRSGTDLRTHSSGPGGSITWSVKTDGAYGGTSSTNVATRLKADVNGLGFFGVTPVARPTVTGSRSSGAALASLLTALASLGLIVDGSTA